MTEANLLQDGIRAVLWLFCQFALWLMDLCYEIINDLVKLNLGNFQFIWSWYRGISALIFFFITIRMFIYFIKATLDDDSLLKLDPLNLLQRIAYIAAILLLIPTFVTGFSELSANMVGSINTLAGIDESETIPSHIVAAAGYNGDIANFDYETIDINKKENGYYVQFASNSDIVFLTFTSIVSCLVFVFIGIQISQRMIGLLLKITIAPFALSGIVNPEDNTFDMWRKLIEADFLTNFFQIVLVMIVMISTALVPLGPIAKCIFFIGALMAVMNAPAGIAQLLGGDVGVGTAFQQMQSLMMLSQGAQLAGQAIAAAALDPQVTLCVANVPAIGDHGGRLVGRSASWPKLADIAKLKDEHRKIIAESSYFDHNYLAKRIKCETYMGTGFIDRVCPPTSVYAAYNNLPKSVKKYIQTTPDKGHNAPLSIGSKRISSFSKKK